MSQTHTRPALLRRASACRKQEVPTTQLQALRRAGAPVFDLTLLVDSRRRELAAAGTHPWEADPATASLFLATWIAQVHHTLGAELLDSDEREDPSTAGFVPLVTYRQVWSLLEPVGTGSLSPAAQRPTRLLDRQRRRPARRAPAAAHTAGRPPQARPRDARRR